MATTQSIEDYLRTIYALYEELDDKSLGVKSVDVAKSLNVSKPSVSAMIKKLVAKRYLKSKRYFNIYFTKKGLEEAKRVMHAHRVLEVFLRDILNYNLSKVHDEAHRMEHAFSEESLKRLDNFLKNPKQSPFGKQIPH